MSQKNFAITPSVSISRSKFKRPSQYKSSFNLGQIIPIYVDADILPGDTVSMDLATLVRMSNPVAPIMDNIYIDYYAFYAPNRILFDEWKKFMGENTTGFGAASEPNYPITNIAGISRGSIGDYMGLPLGISSGSCLVSALPARMYAIVYNEWFRDQNLIAPIVVTTSASNGAYTFGGVNNYHCLPFTAAKESDYFTRSLPYAQKGSPVTLPLGSTADLVVTSQGSSLAAGSSITVSNIYGINANGSSVVEGVNSGNSYHLKADLSTATAATINQLRFAFQYQKFLEKDALYGSRYWEILKGHFSVEAPDASLQRPELLGHWRQRVNIDQVLQTTGSDVSTPSNNKLGVPGANSVTGGNSSLFTKSFVEHGCLMILAVARHDQTYSQGVNRMWTRKHRTDFYFPVFANLGAQEVLSKEIYADGSSADENVFGYQEAWAEYRYRPSLATNFMNASRSGSMGWWTLANNFASRPTLSQSFIEQDRNSLARCLVTGSTGPDFIFDAYIDATYVRPMPLYSVPGLIDHH